MRDPLDHHDSGFLPSTAPAAKQPEAPCPDTEPAFDWVQLRDVDPQVARKLKEVFPSQLAEQLARKLNMAETEAILAKCMRPAMPPRSPDEAVAYWGGVPWTLDEIMRNHG